MESIKDLENINPFIQHEKQTSSPFSKTAPDSSSLFKERVLEPIENGVPSSNLARVKSLQNACENKEWDRVVQLVSTMGCIEVDEEGNTPLHYLAGTAPREYIDKLSTYLQQHPVEREAKNRRGLTALHIAAIRGSPSISEQLVSFGCRLESEDNEGNTPLSTACIHSKPQTIATLLAYKANANTYNNKVMTPLHIVSAKGHHHTVEMLISASANINARDSYGGTPLHTAARCFHEKVIDTLLKCNADATAQDEDAGETPLFHLLDQARNVASANYQGLIEKDEGLTEEILNRKLLAQVFGIEGFTPLAKQNVDLEAYPVCTTIIHQTEATSTYYQKLIASQEAEEDPWSELLATLTFETRSKARSLASESLRQILENTTSAISLCYPDEPEEAINKVLQGGPVGILVNTPEHVSALVFYNGKVARGNKGEGCGRWPGILIHTMGDSKDIEKCLRTCIPNDIQVSYLKSEIDKDLDLNPNDKRYLAQKEQKIGNCVIASTNSMELALLFLQLEPLMDHTEAEELARAIQKFRVHHSKMAVLTDYLKKDVPSRRYPPDLMLLGMLYKKKSSYPSIDRQTRTLIRHWCKRNDVTSDALNLVDDLWRVGRRTIGTKRKTRPSDSHPHKKTAPPSPPLD